MTTFLPYPDIRKCAACLDWRRLGKQRLEAFQIIRCLDGIGKGWRNHPAVRMWVGFREMLVAYMNECIREWKRRGYVNNMKIMPTGKIVEPWWWGGEVHASHRRVLLSKNFEWYSQFGWTEEPVYAYYWPSRDVQCSEHR